MDTDEQFSRKAWCVFPTKSHLLNSIVGTNNPPPKKATNIEERGIKLRVKTRQIHSFFSYRKGINLQPPPNSWCFLQTLKNPIRQKMHRTSTWFPVLAYIMSSVVHFDFAGFCRSGKLRLRFLWSHLRFLRWEINKPKLHLATRSFDPSEIRTLQKPNGHLCGENDHPALKNLFTRAVEGFWPIAI